MKVFDEDGCGGIETKVRPTRTMPQWESSRYRHGTPSKEVYHAVGVPGWPTKEMKRSAFAGKGEFRIPVQTARSISEVQIPLGSKGKRSDPRWDSTHLRTAVGSVAKALFSFSGPAIE